MMPKYMTTIELKRMIVRDNLVPKILEELGCHNIKEHTGYVTAANPDGDNPTAINCRVDSDFLNVMNYTRSMKEHADIIDLVQFIQKCNFVEAIKFLHRVAGVKFSFYSKEKIKKAKEDPFSRLRKLKEIRFNVSEVRPIDEAVLGEFTNIEWVGLWREGVTPRACEKFGIMYSYKWKRIIFPHRYALDGSLLAYNARTTVDNYEEFGISKYYITPGYQKADNVYGLWENRQAIEEADCCIVVESEKSVVKRYSVFDGRFVSVSGHVISEEQKRLLIGLNISEIVISFDNDISEYDIWAACEKFYQYKIVSYTKDDWGILGKKDSIADVPDKKCRQLIKNRHRYTEEKHDKYIQKRSKSHAING